MALAFHVGTTKKYNIYIYNIYIKAASYLLTFFVAVSSLIAGSPIIGQDKPKKVSRS